LICSVLLGPQARPPQDDGSALPSDVDFAPANDRLNSSAKFFQISFQAIIGFLAQKT
jgi:hypothetical protein